MDAWIRFNYRNDYYTHFSPKNIRRYITYNMHVKQEMMQLHHADDDDDNDVMLIIIIMS